MRLPEELIGIEFVTSFLFLVARMLLIAMPLLLVAMPFATSGFLLLPDSCGILPLDALVALLVHARKCIG